MGCLVMVGLSHTAASLEVRERVAIEEPTWRQSAPKAPASVLLSTCNRVEVYAWADKRPRDVARSLQRALASSAKIDLAELEPYLSTLSGRDALLHLVRVTSGLDSLVVGEEQIRGQVRDALRAAEATAEASGRLPPPLRGIFQRVGESARRVRGNSQLSKTPSIASAGVNVAVRGIPGGIQGQLAVVLGAGVMARAAAEAVAHHGARIKVLNRTPGHAQRLIEQLGRSSTIESSSLEALPDALAEAVLVVCATASRLPVVSHAAVEAAMPARGDRPLVILDVALPRDVEPSVRDLPGVKLIDLDDLERLCPLDPGVRHEEQAHAEALAAAEADRLADWLRLRAVSPAIAELRTYAEAVRRCELQRSAGRLRDLSPEQIAAVDALTTGIVNKLMHGPTVALRDAAGQRGGAGRTHSRILRILRPTPGRNGLTDHGV